MAQMAIKGNITPTFLEQVLRRAGLQPGDEVLVRVHPRRIEIAALGAALEPVAFTAEERAHRLSVVRRLYGLWSEDDETQI